MKKRNMRWLVLGAVVGALTCGMCAQAQEEVSALAEEEKSPLSVEASVDVLSDYIWRGMISNDNPVWQPSVTVGFDAGDFGSLGLNVWQTYDLTHKRGTATNSRRAGGLQEIDYTLTYGLSLGDFDLELGHVFYTFPDNNGHSDQEVYASVAYNNDFVTPSAAAYWNYSDSAGNDTSYVYFTLGLSHDFEVAESLTLSPGASLGFGDHAMTGSEGGTELTDSTVGLSASYAVTDNFSLGAQLNYTWTPSHTLRHEGWMGEDKDQILWGGVSAKLSF